ncbi:hypothetical protein ACIP5Y_41565 [Nocardia sp. NPDC088792]|uniref:hypothetical protein n=1 Tax=Nocardia sp. NPDC088792 TaxID=3364332 RepID=UPI00382530BF
MKLQNTGRIAVATLALVAALGLTACGSGDKGTTKPAATTSASAAAQNSNFPPAPTTADLNAELQKALDPNVPDDQKLDLMQGVSADPSLPSRLAAAFKQNNASITVNNVTDLGNGSATADATATINGGAPNQMVVPLVVEDGKWKVQKEWICNSLQLANQTSPACS